MANKKTIDCEEGKHGDCKGWGETIFRVPRERVTCECGCHDGPFSGVDLEACQDETLPPDHVKFLHADNEASVYRLDLEKESGKLVATWPERS